MTLGDPTVTGTVSGYPFLQTVDSNSHGGAQLWGSTADPLGHGAAEKGILPNAGCRNLPQLPIKISSAPTDQSMGLFVGTNLKLGLPKIKTKITFDSSCSICRSD